MVEILPFLYSPLALGVIFTLIFATSVVILTIPVFATRGTAQMIWFGVTGFLLTVEAVVLVTLAVLNSQGEIF